jgi:hypothetical protein
VSIPKDTKADKGLLERVKQGATEKLMELEAKKQKEKKRLREYLPKQK